MVLSARSDAGRAAARFGRSEDGLLSHLGSGNTYSYDTVRNANLGFYVYGAVGDKFAHNTLTGNEYGAYEDSTQNDTWTANHFAYNTGWGYYDNFNTGSTIL